MNSDIQKETTAIFFSSELFFLKRGIRSEYVMLNFICMVLLALREARTENYNMRNSCTQWDSNPGLSV